jgi:hypothetical protein
MSKYPLTGPFSNNSTPGINSTFLNNLETYLEYVADSNISVDGSGNMTVASIVLTHGTLTRIAFGFSSVTTGGTTITHNLGANPSGIFLQPSASGITAYASSTVTTTTFTAFTVGGNNNLWWLAIA